LFKVYVTIRPGAEAFIEQLSEFYDIILWTASLREYADPVMDFIDPNKRAIGRLYRESCTPIQ
jgi:RNA polymerase II subunit A small phosphatase-like protein